MARAILFDFDGTLVEMRAGLWDLIEQTSREFDLGLNTPDDFYKAFEGNFYEWLAGACRDSAHAAAVKARLLELVRDNYNPPFIPGMVDVVRTLAATSTLGVLSSNGIAVIRRVLGAHDVATCFSHVFSGEIEPSKTASIRRFVADERAAVRRNGTVRFSADDATLAPLTRQQVVVVTDTVGDVREALEAGVRAVGVSWGMHGEQKLLEAGAERVALWPQELISWLRGTQQSVPGA